MTDAPVSRLTYNGPHAKVQLRLPGRLVTAKRGETIAFEADELEQLDPVDWTGTRHGPAPDNPAEGTIAQVLARVAADPDAAAEALAAETAKAAPRPKLVASLEAIAANTTTEADAATDQGS